jgi:hypothetical protein
MRNHSVIFIVSLTAALTLPPATLAQRSEVETTAQSSTDSHDISGIWMFYQGTRGQGIYATPGKDVPPLTPWAQARYDSARPGFGPKAVFKDGNDPILQCDPTGLPRALFYPAEDPHEIVQNPDRVLMLFESNHLWRQIWTDGRGHPNNLTPTWMGHSIGWWDGDMFVVDSVGFNDKSWLDAYGHPHSEELHLVERYRRVDHDTLTMQIVIDDPKAYKTTWVSDTKIFKLLPKSAPVKELFCIRAEEDAFTRGIREPVAGNSSK